LTLLLRESDVRDLLTVPEAVSLVREALATQATVPGGMNIPRRRAALEHGVLHVMAASVPGARAAGLKAYSVGRAGPRFLVALWDRGDGRLLALIEADLLGRIRTGAASGVASDILARPDAAVLAVLGTGRQAVTQIEGVAAVRGLSEVKVFCRTVDRRIEFAREMTKRLDLPVKPADSAQAAVDGAGIVCTVTTAAAPVVLGRWLAEGTHVNAAGSNFATRREVDAEALERAALIAVDSVEQAQMEAGDLIMASAEGAFTWDRAIELQDILAGRATGRTAPEQITVFKSLGIAVEDVAVARHVYDKATAEGRGETTTFGEIG
jgi:alanine dehydrogenase